MGKGYSIDLRERVLNAIDEGSSKQKAHLLFRVSRSTINHWFELRAQTGSMAPRVQGNRRAPQLQGAVFEEFVKRHAPSALAEMAQAWQQEQGVILSAMSFSRALRALGWTRKKRVGVIKSARQRRGQSLCRS